MIQVPSNLIRFINSFVILILITVCFYGWFQVELVNECRRLLDVQPFCLMLKVILRKGDRQEKLLDNQISSLVARGKSSVRTLTMCEYTNSGENIRASIERKPMWRNGRAFGAEQKHPCSNLDRGGWFSPQK